jgi:CheY-like chemotaxis protein
MSSKNGPIIILEDDEDERHILSEVLRKINRKNEVKFFKTGVELLDYIMSTKDKPMLIISDVNVPVMNGLELRRLVNESNMLRRKSIPFVFLSTTASRKTVEEAYDLSVQGFFVKQNSYKEIERHLRMILDYWSECRHTNSD